MSGTRRARRPTISEAQLQAGVIETAQYAGFSLVFHDHDSRRNQRGLPDLILCHPQTGRTIYIELKSATGKVRPDQQKWLDGLRIRNEVYLWRPEDWFSGEIQRVLLGRRVAERAASPTPATMGA